MGLFSYTTNTMAKTLPEKAASGLPLLEIRPEVAKLVVAVVEYTVTQVSSCLRRPS